MTTTSTGATERLPLRTILTFSATSLPISALGIALSIFLQPYVAGHLGVGLTAVGAAWFWARILDIPVDPALGILMDHTRTRLGRYRVWMLAGAPILMLGVFMLFMAPKGIDFIYLVVWLLVMYLGSSMATLSHTAWGAVLATNYNERSRVFGVLAAVGVVGALGVLILVGVVGKSAERNAALVPAIGWFVLAALPLCIGVVAAFTPEKVAPVAPQAARLKPLEYVILLLKLLIKPNILRLVAAEIFLTLGPGWMAALYLFFFRDVLGFTTGGASLLLAAYVASGVAGAPITGWVATRLGKHRTMMATTTAYSLGLVTVLWIPHGNMLGGLPTMLWCGFMASGFGLMVRAMIADVSDELRLEQGVERVSLVYGLLTAATKFAAGGAVMIAYPLLDRFGYHAKEGVVNSPAAIKALEYTYLFGPIFFVMLGGACFIGWKLDAARHGEIRRALDERDALYEKAPIIETVETQGG